MIDFLRTIFPHIYVLFTILVLLFVIYRISLSHIPKEIIGHTKKFFKWILIGIISIFSIVVIRMAVLNEVPRSDVDNSVKKERSNYAIEKSKRDTLTIK